VAALLELSEQGTSAKPASVAVYALLEDPDPMVAVYAAGALREINGDAWSSVKTLAAHLAHEDERIVRLAAYLLGQMGPEAMDAVPQLQQVRDSQHGVTSLHAAEALTHIAPDDGRSVQTLSAALHDQNREMRWFAAVSLGTVRGSAEAAAAQSLRDALRDSEAEVRAAACLSLGGLGVQARIALADLEHARQSDTPEVQMAAETALACLKE
jgi:HEAT repeat protein